MGKGWDMTMGEGYINSGISVDGHVVRIASTVTSTFASAGMDVTRVGPSWCTLHHVVRSDCC